MRVAVLFDIHGNLPALEAVLGEVRQRGVDRVVVGGDVIPGPMSAECLALLRDLPEPTDFVFGNGELDVIAAHLGQPLPNIPPPIVEILQWTAGQLSEEDRGWVMGWDETVTLEGLGGGDGVLVCHAVPQNPRDIFTDATPESALLPVFSEVRPGVILCGHTHLTFDRQVGRHRVINPGSVGMPFGDPGAYWALVTELDVESCYTSFDLSAAAARVSETAYPQAAGFAQGYVLAPPTAEKMRTSLEAGSIANRPQPDAKS